jgi:hypothetical protein
LCYLVKNIYIPDLNDSNLKKNEYNGWKVIYVIGDLRISSLYSFDETTSFLTIRTEDSYIHLLKKLGLAIQFYLKTFDIQDGILRCGDDLVFNESILTKFLNNSDKKYHFIGTSPRK